MDILIPTLTGLVTLLLGALVTKVLQEKKLEKLGSELKGELKEVTRSIVDLDSRLIRLIERMSSQHEELEGVHNQLEEIFNRLREAEKTITLNTQRIENAIEHCPCKNK